MNRAVFFGLLLTNVIWAGSYTATKVLMAHAPFFLITSLRYLIAVLPLLAIIVAARGGGLRSPDRSP